MKVNILAKVGILTKVGILIKISILSKVDNFKLPLTTVKLRVRK